VLVEEGPVRAAHDEGEEEAGGPGVEGGEEGALVPAVEPAGGAEEDDDVIVQVLRQLLPLEVLWCSRVR